MLSLDSRHGYFFWPELPLPPAKTARGLKPWSRGKRLSGYTEERGFLTNGDEDATFLGFKWVEKWRERKGYRLVDIDVVHDFLFVVAEVEPIFVGEPGLHLDGLAPAQVAIPVEAIHSKSEPGRFSKGYGYAPDKVLKALATHAPNIRIREISSYRCVFTAESPLLPAVWADLGFHAISNKPEPTLNVLGYGVPAHGIPVPFFHIEDAAKFGLSRIKAVGISSTGLLCENLVVSDPSLAAKVSPIFGKIKAGTNVRFRERLQLGYTREHFFFGIRPDACGAILSIDLDAAGLDYVEEYGGLVVLPFRGIELAPQTILNVQIEYGRSAYIASPDVADSHFTTKAESVPHSGATLAPLFVDGKARPSEVYLRSQTTPRPTKKQRKQKRGSRLADLTAIHGDRLPSYWSRLPDDAQVAAAVDWETRKAEGWLELKPFAALFGLGSIGKLDEWVKALGVPAATHPFEANPDLFKPMTFEELAELPNFIEALNLVLPNRVPFIVRCALNEKVRGAMFGATIAA